MGRLELVRVDELPLGKRPLYFGTVGRDVRELQSILKEMKFLNNEPSGEYDYLTIDAVKCFQRSFNLCPNGNAGFRTLKMLKEPGIKERIYLQLKKDDNPTDLGLNQQVGLSAFKNVEDRRRIKRVRNYGNVMIEKREVWTVVPEISKENALDHCCSGLMLSGNNIDVKSKKEPDIEHKTVNKEIGILPLYSAKAEEDKGIYSSGIEDQHSKRGLVWDLRDISRIPKKTRKALSKKCLEERKPSNLLLVFWWLSSPGSNYGNLPDDREADGIIFSPTISVEETSSHQAWYRQIKNILNVYPCTRILVHFNLQGLEKNDDGEVSLSACDSRALRISSSMYTPINSKRVGEDGWVFVRYKRNDQERSALIPDMRTVRGILSRVDRLNLAGVVITGDDFLGLKTRNEMNRFFMVSPRKWVIN